MSQDERTNTTQRSTTKILGRNSSCLMQRTSYSNASWFSKCTPKINTFDVGLYSILVMKMTNQKDDIQT